MHAIAMAIITNHYPDEREENLGILEGGTGLGLLVGPLLGGASVKSQFI